MRVFARVRSCALVFGCTAVCSSPVPPYARSPPPYPKETIRKINSILIERFHAHARNNAQGAEVRLASVFQQDAAPCDPPNT